MSADTPTEDLLRALERAAEERQAWREAHPREAAMIDSRERQDRRRLAECAEEIRDAMERSNRAARRQDFANADMWWRGARKSAQEYEAARLRLGMSRREAYEAAPVSYH
jgi:hypothetical protein